ncbi:NAD(P)-dependent oxidoreductase [Microbacterium sp. SORGH_AS_0888]|uniref:NAD-dependent epimerase/dehydratase family protein n=1 Tax=Microbacterium sp. SORGH_AS_0888 TaxID=3041791 RepID=UPI00277E5837|nr:NAD(P)-dependent oxidoreductase [Microbacterium sp. SORGH_AS_0888]MDQ1127882.1 nucleoside-diphosphate-sugar epimerase [Microbacterium sp. SORGH_AS_0888]
MNSSVNDAARALFSAQIAPDSRVLVTGASGWFGRTAVDLLEGTSARLLCIASSARIMSVNGREFPLGIWNLEEIRAFAPSIVIDCAFLTKDRLAANSSRTTDEYVRVNRLLTSQMLLAAELPSVQSVLTISSGAAVYPQDALQTPFEENTYGALKREAEQSLMETALRRGIHAVAARAWAVSGGHVQQPRTFALSDMVLQARDGNVIEIKATSEVWRRYTAVEDLLAVAMATVHRRSGIVESGGPLVEMSDLAVAVRDAVRPSAEIRRPPVDPREANRYHNDGIQWRIACSEFDYVPIDLSSQIIETAQGLRAASHGSRL